MAHVYLSEKKRPAQLYWSLSLSLSLSLSFYLFSYLSEMNMTLRRRPVRPSVTLRSERKVYIS